MKKKKIIIFGGSGFLASNLADELSKKKFDCLKCLVELVHGSNINISGCCGFLILEAIYCFRNAVRF